MTKDLITNRHQFEIDPAIIHHIIYSQAGSIAKALIELLMNSVDAKGTAVSLTITCEGFECQDNGVGFKTREDVLRYFGRFGTPHFEGDAKYGRFRLGRGQIMAHASTHWRSHLWMMDVDTRTNGHVYDLTEKGNEGVSGCLIRGKWYEPLAGSELKSTVQEIRDLVRYALIAVTLNGDVITKDLKSEKWDFEDEVACYRLKAEGSVALYNQGVLVRHDPGHMWGVGGVIVSKRAIDLNVSRTEILRKTCPTWKHIVRVFTPLANAYAEELGARRKTEERRTNSAHALMAAGPNFLKIYENEEVVTLLPGKRHIRLIDFVGKSWRYSSFTIINGNEDISIGEAIANYGGVAVIHPATMDRFRCQSPEELHLELQCILKTVNERSVEADNEWRKQALSQARLPKMVAFDVLKEQFIPHTKVLNESKSLDRETLRAWTALKWCLFCFATDYLNGWVDAAPASYRNVRGAKVKGPSILVGESNRYAAWTDGTTYVAFDIKHVKALKSDPMLAAGTLFTLLEHELAHHGDSLEAGHDEVFYQRYHDLTMTMVRARQRYLAKWVRKYVDSLEGPEKRRIAKAQQEAYMLERAGEGREKQGLGAMVEELTDGNEQDIYGVQGQSADLHQRINSALVEQGHAPVLPDFEDVLDLAEKAQIEKQQLHQFYLNEGIELGSFDWFCEEVERFLQKRMNYNGGDYRFFTKGKTTRIIPMFNNGFSVEMAAQALEPA